MDTILDLRGTLEAWPYDVVNHVRMCRGCDGREIIQLREEHGIQQFDADGHPGGHRVHGLESLLDLHETRLAAALHRGHTCAFELSPEACALLIHEGMAYQERTRHLVEIADWPRVERDTARNLRLIAFIRRHARCEEDRADFDPWHPDLTRLHAVARAIMQMEKGDSREARKLASAVGHLAAVADDSFGHAQIAEALQTSLRDCFHDAPTLPSREESEFRQEGDYWIIAYQGHRTLLKCSRGLQCLAFLLRHPGREFHVSELLAHLLETPTPHAPSVTNGHRNGCGNGAADQLVIVGSYSGDPLLDPEAKAQYKRRLTELRADLHEAEQRNDPHRATKAEDEMEAIAQHLAAAIGLGGRDRKTSSEAERARSAITKRIKQAIHKIAEVIPSLGLHLTVSVKTGYLCSYIPILSKPAAWMH